MPIVLYPQIPPGWWNNRGGEAGAGTPGLLLYEMGVLKVSPRFQNHRGDYLPATVSAPMGGKYCFASLVSSRLSLLLRSLISWRKVLTCF